MKESTKTILKTSGITLAITAGAIVVIALLISLVFPSAAFDFCYDLGDKENALVYAERCIAGKTLSAESGELKYLTHSIELSEFLFNKTGKTNFAEKIEKYTQEYIAIEGIEKYTAQLDEYYISASTPLAKVGNYSYYSHIVTINARAKAVLGAERKIIWRSELTAFDQTLQGESNLIDSAALFSGISEWVINDDTFLTDILDTEFYSRLTAAANAFMKVSMNENGLKRLFLLRSVLYLIQDINQKLEEKQLASPEWKEMLRTDLGEGNLETVYYKLLNEYVSN